MGLPAPILVARLENKLTMVRLMVRADKPMPSILSAIEAVESDLELLRSAVE